MSNGGDRNAGKPGSTSRSGIDDGGTDAESGVPDFRDARRHVLTELIRFETQLRNDGAEIAATASLDAAKAVGVVGLSERNRVADTLRTTLLSDPRDFEAFEERFPAFWNRLRNGIEAVAAEPDSDERFEHDSDVPIAYLSTPSYDGHLEAGGPRQTESDDQSGHGLRLRTSRRRLTDEPEADLEGGATRRYSPTGAGESVDAMSVTLEADELAAIDRFAATIATIPGRRHRPRNGRIVDARRALRASLATGGTPVEIPAREAIMDERRICLLLDVSGSVLDTIDPRTVLGFAERLQTAARSGRVFVFDDGFLEVTAQFERADGDPAASLREAQITWGGGTKIGAALETLRTRHRDAVDQRTVVVVVSDGLDVGEADVLEQGITWLASRTGGVVWLNPLAGSPTYEPRARGMATCLPYIDALFGFRSPDDLAEAARQLDLRGLSGPVGYEHDPRRCAASSTTGRNGR